MSGFGNSWSALERLTLRSEHEAVEDGTQAVEAEFPQWCDARQSEEPEWFADEGRHQALSCYAPLHGWLSKERTAAGKRMVVFQRQEGFSDRPVTVPCGSCDGCKLSRAREWSIRIMHEAQMWPQNCFVTLTYKVAPVSDLPLDTLVPEDFQGFMKRLRERRREAWVGGAGELFQGPRYFVAGEYGDQGRPHYHAILFNCAFPDKTLWSRNGGKPLFRSAELESLWQFGYSTVGEVTLESASYVAQYCLKKVKGPFGSEALRHPEFVRMSRKPGLGKGWAVKFGSDVFPSDEVVVEGQVRGRAPRYYLGTVDKATQKVISSRRIRAVRARLKSTGEVMADAEHVKRRKRLLAERRMQSC